MKNFQSSVVIGIMCFFLSLGIAIQISSIKNESTVVAKEKTENQLRNQVIELNENYNKELKNLEKTQKDLESLRNSASKSNANAASWSDQLTKINNCLGYNDVKGKGVKIELESGNLLKILNALNNSGAEAISINGKRITLYSEIVNNGDICTLDGNELETPFIIEAIGSPAMYNAITMPDSYIDLLRKGGHSVKVESLDEITINKYDGIYNFNFAKNVN